MKFLLSTAAAIALFAADASAFAPAKGRVATFGVSSRGNVVVNMADDKLPFFAAASEAPAESELNSMTEEEEVETMVQAEIKKVQKVSNLRNANGVDYAPWMKISKDDETKIRQLMKEKTDARRRRDEQEREVSGNLYFDSQAQELSGAGLSYKVVDKDNVELEWATKTEENTKGFIVKRRPAKTDTFEVIADYQTWGPLASKGADGGVYRYLDTGATAGGGFVYRISECDKNDKESDLCQCLVDLQTEDEQKASVLAAVAIVAFGMAAVVAGVVLDPMNGY
eukprot:CAMPEP_0198294648 /NCGR_PEP_ID=MMETSP1449-20131203/23492_1 /TAXON_ID=420275 /ORGANISM="Attheya septentrionalis, Strain CCMP2084" /LENGTH=281 /DNA_ID=CAMNT_0043994659 /DNA_START=46 /DNA_END=891 /DNA_ORIENTATION=+